MPAASLERRLNKPVLLKRYVRVNSVELWTCTRTVDAAIEVTEDAVTVTMRKSDAVDVAIHWQVCRGGKVYRVRAVRQDHEGDEVILVLSCSLVRVSE